MNHRNGSPLFKQILSHLPLITVKALFDMYQAFHITMQALKQGHIVAGLNPLKIVLQFSLLRVLCPTMIGNCPTMIGNHGGPLFWEKHTEIYPFKIKR